MNWQPRVRINESPDTREIPQNGPADDDDDISRGGADSGGGGSAASGEILCEGLLRRKKEDHGRFEDPYKMVCVCRLQGSVLRVRLTHNGEVVGLEEQFDLHKDWRLMPRSDKPGRFSLNRIRNSLDNANTATFKADNKDEGNGTSSSCLCVPFSFLPCASATLWLLGVAGGGLMDPAASPPLTSMSVAIKLNVHQFS